MTRTWICVGVALVGGTVALWLVILRHPRAEDSVSKSEVDRRTPNRRDRTTSRGSSATRMEPVLSLDNFGGITHGGLRVKCFEDGYCIAERYSDVSGQLEVSHGECRLDLVTGVVTLHMANAIDGSPSELRRLSYGGVTYWVVPDEVLRISRPQEDTLRLISLREVALPTTAR